MEDNSETFSVACPRCGHTYKVPIKLLNKKALCPSCKAKFTMEPPAGPLGRELIAKHRALTSNNPEDVLDNPVDGQIMRPSSTEPVQARKQQELTNCTIKLNLFSKKPDPIGGVSAEQEKHPGLGIDSAAVHAALSENKHPMPHRVSTISPDLLSSRIVEQEKKKWWKFWG